MHVDAEVSLLQAASLFQNRRIKFLPIIVPGSATVLALISHVEILEVRGGVGCAGIRCVGAGYCWRYVSTCLCEEDRDARSTSLAGSDLALTFVVQLLSFVRMIRGFEPENDRFAL